MSHPERIIPDETSPGIVALHLKRYDFALPHCRGRRVLDAGCGVGYGTAHLAEAAAHVLGVDADDASVGYAQQRYAAPNVEFAVMDLGALALDDASFDVACMFEVIEHLPDRDGALAEIARVLRPDGLLVVSTPQAPATTERPENPFHLVEYSRGDFEALLRRHFDGVELYGQQRLQTQRHRLAQRVDVLGLRRRLPLLRRASRRLLGTAPMAEIGAADVAISRDGIEHATEIVAVCSQPRRA